MPTRELNSSTLAKLYQLVDSLHQAIALSITKYGIDYWFESPEGRYITFGLRAAPEDLAYLEAVGSVIQASGYPNFALKGIRYDGKSVRCRYTNKEEKEFKWFTFNEEVFNGVINKLVGIQESNVELINTVLDKGQVYETANWRVETSLVQRAIVIYLYNPLTIAEYLVLAD